MATITATYSPDDNKLRLYVLNRFDAATLARVKDAGFRWAPMQKLFFAPRWTPEAEDLALELAEGEIGDEDSSLLERAEIREERFQGYSANRRRDAEAARAGVDRIANGIPMGQPILVGHHSEKHARRDAKRIEDGMRREFKMWRTADYWKQRASGAISHAKYKERPEVRHCRIKTIEADARREQRRYEKAQKLIEWWLREGLDMRRARALAGECWINMSFPLSTWPREPPASQSEREMSLCSALEGGIVTPEQARDLAIPRHEMIAELAQRWIVHCQLRLEYERAMLAETGWTPPPRPKTKTDLPLLNYGGEVSYRNRWREGNTTGIAVGITKAEWAAIGNDYKGTERSACGTHRIRTAMHVRGDHGVQIVYITDSKQHPRPSAEAVATQAKAERAALDRELDRRTEEQQARAAAREANAPARAEREEARARIQELAGAIKAGVKVVSAPQLFPTPAPLAAQMVELLEVQDGDRVLEPSAGTGRLLQAIADARNAGGAVPAEVIAVEVSTELARGLHDQVPHLCSDVHPVNFLETDETKLGGRFERIVANPPFGGGADIQHIMHALSLLAPGGRLVALCAGGPRQETALRPRASSWEVLPEGSFAAEGTNVRVVLAVFDQP